jgi:hypothetical protein
VVGVSFSEEEVASCWIGGGTAGMVIGTDLIENPAGQTLAVCEDEGAVKCAGDPVTLLNRAALNFGEVEAKKSKTTKFEFESNVNVKYVQVIRRGAAFTKGNSTCTGMVAAKAKCEVEITFTPAAAKTTYRGELGIDYVIEGTGEEILDTFLLRGKGK